MSGPDEIPGSTGTSEEKFLSAEYAALIELDKARNERLDRFLTIYMTLAASPWALYALLLKDHSNVPSFLEMPSPIAIAFTLIGILGGLVAMMYIQVWFNIVLYMRSVNAIRGYFLEANTRLSFHLPTNSDVPPYDQKRSYIQFAVAAMALVDSGYIGLGLFNLIHWPNSSYVRILALVALGASCWIGHMWYFKSQARTRENHSRGRSLRWRQ
jgi:hypothetical protein